MKKIFLIFILNFFFSPKSFAETWSCIYEFGEKSNQYIINRKGRKFITIHANDLKDTVGHTIVKENNDFVHLYKNYPDDDTAFFVILDKKNEAFVMTALQYSNSSAIIEGKCRIY